jgi:putative methyltransferase (TIGR01177 family)
MPHDLHMHRAVLARAPVQQPAMWSRRQWKAAGWSYLAAVLLMGVAGETLPGASAGRVVPVQWWNYVTLVLMPARARQRLIDQVWQALPAPQVRLTSPDYELHVYITPAGLWWAEMQGRTGVEALRSHDPMARPFFRSVLVPRRRARCLVNLTGVRPGQRLLDPFCGTGALLVEAGLLGAAAFGSDVDRAMVSGCRANLAFENVAADVRRIDARALGDWGLMFDAVVTDLPYGRSASAHGVQLPDLFQAFLGAAAGVVRDGARVVVMAPAGLPEPSNTLFDVITVLRERVNRSLMREIWVLYRRSRRSTPVAAASR